MLQLLTITFVVAEVDLQPEIFFTVTAYEPLSVTVILLDVDPVFQRLPVEALEVNITLSPIQKVVGPLAVITGIGGNGFTVTFVVGDVATHLFASVTRTW